MHIHTQTHVCEDSNGLDLRDWEDLPELVDDEKGKLSIPMSNDSLTPRIPTSPVVFFLQNFIHVRS